MEDRQFGVLRAQTRPRSSQLRMLVVLLGAAAVAACGGEDTATRNPGEGVGAGSGEVLVVPVTGRSYAFEPAQLSVPAGQPFEVALQVAADDTMHDLVIDGMADRPVGAVPGATGSGFFQIDEPGEYLIYCGIEGHRAAGMTGTLIVTGE